MHARLMQAKAKPGQVKEFVKALVERGLPILKQQPGFIDALALTSDTERDEFYGITVWRTKEDAEKYLNDQGKQSSPSVTATGHWRPALHCPPHWTTLIPPLTI
jgi:heme-degrading monooxygenase HmoA